MSGILAGLVCTNFVAMPALAQEYVAGRDFDNRLQQTLTGGLTDQSLVDAVNRVARQRGVSVVIDRNLDPNKTVTVRFQQTAIRDVIRQIAREVDADTSELKNTVFVGPTRSAGRLATLIKLRQKELTKFRAAKALRKSRDVEWPMLAEPRKLVSNFATKNQIRIQNIDMVPHDLWNAAKLPQTDGITALSVILIQFDLTFEFQDAGKAIRLVQVPEQLAIEERIRLTKKSPSGLQEIAARRFPKAKIKRSGSYLRVTATAEVINEIRKLALGESPTARSPSGQSLEGRTFILRVSDVPARAILNKVKEQGTPIEWDETSLKNAGVDLDRRVNMNVQDASVREFFTVLCDQLAISFRVEKQRVVLFPKR